MTASEIRQQFLDFFKSKGHTIVSSAPIVVKDDPTLLFTNAGMNQFKDYFLGNKTPQYTRIADTQKCLRVSGKHNDLEEVGVDTYHHTMFEMLGNWSFGDYFKQEAIEWSWKLLTEVYGIDKDRIYVTVFEGDVKENLPFDHEAYEEWKKYIGEERILKGNKKDNFWEMGDTGPCGPCSEIHVDCRSEEEREKTDGALLVNADHPQVIEIWNNVFMEFNRLKDGSLQTLPAKHVDTGMGFERLVRVLQQKQSNYDTDVFSDYIRCVENITQQKYTGSNGQRDIAFRVLADHIRTIVFAISDGQLPSNTGAGYVIRRILRRAVRYYYSALNYSQPLLYQLAESVALQFKQVFPEAYQQLEFITKVIKEEEEAFLRTLEKGLKRIDEMMLKNKAQKILKGEDTFELYDTYGFPLDLSRLIAEEKGFKIDEEGFETEMTKQKERSRAATNIDTDDWQNVNEGNEVEFVGYDDLNITTQVLRYRQIKTKNKTAYQIVLASTPFYAESGGQIGDKGVLIFGEEVIQVIDTKKENNLIVHYVEQLPQNIQQEVVAKVNWENRILTSYNHTATHLMHAALRQVLGVHVMQKGSLVNNEMLRFDFSHFAKMSEDEILSVERLVNKKIRENIPVVIKEMSKEEAIAMGAMALFGEKYGDKVRVITIDAEYSVELCGGTHIGSTGMIGLFKIITETSVAAGVRRIEALTGVHALQYIEQKISENKQIVDLLKTKAPTKAIEKLIDENVQLKKRIESLENKQLNIIKNELLQGIEKVETAIGSINFIGKKIDVDNADALKKICFDIKANIDDYVIVLSANINGKASVAIGIGDSLTETLKLDAAKIIKNVIAPLIKGGGGGQKNLATAGGQETAHLTLLVDKVKTTIMEG